MRRYINVLKTFSLALLAMAFSACEDTDTPRISSDTQGPQITWPLKDNYVLTVTNADETFETFEWEAVDYGVVSPVSYKVQVAEKGTDFETVEEVASTTDTKVEVSNSMMNDAVGKLGLAPFEAHEVEMRVISTLGNNGGGVISSTVADTEITPYALIVTWYVPGPFNFWAEGNEWSHNDLDVIKAEDGQNFRGYLYLVNKDGTTPSDFKISTAKGWDLGINYGAGDAAGTLSDDGGAANITAPEAAYFLLTVNSADLTYNLLKTDFAIIGAATPGGWDNDTPLTFNPDSRMWEGTYAMKGGEEWKIRANGSWDDPNPNYGQGSEDGMLSLGGDNLVSPAEDGMYEIKVNLDDPEALKYTIEKVN